MIPSFQFYGTLYEMIFNKIECIFSWFMNLQKSVKDCSYKNIQIEPEVDRKCSQTMVHSRPNKSKWTVTQKLAVY